MNPDDNFYEAMKIRCRISVPVIRCLRRINPKRWADVTVRDVARIGRAVISLEPGVGVRTLSQLDGLMSAAGLGETWLSGLDDETSSDNEEVMDETHLQLLLSRLRALQRYDHRVCNDGDGRVDDWADEDEEGDYVLWSDIEKLLSEFECVD